MRMRVLSDPRWLTSRLATNRVADGVRLHLCVFGVSVMWLIAVYLAAVIDGTTKLDGVGKGFLEHGGYIALHLATPVVLSIALVALECFAKLVRRIGDFVRNNCSIEPLEDRVAERLSVLNLHSRWTLLLLLLVMTGALSATVVFMQVIEPARTYGNDVFNACRYPFGYYTANLYLAISWIVVFPFTLFTVLQITTSLVIVLNDARRACLLQVDLLNPDNCGGLSPFGDLNLVLMLYYVPPFIAVSALSATHARHYASLIVPAAALSLVFVVQSVVGVYAIHLAIRGEKRDRLEVLHGPLDYALQHPACSPRGELTFLLWQHVRGVKTMPYASNVLTIVNAVRYLPPAIALYNIISASA